MNKRYVRVLLTLEIPTPPTSISDPDIYAAGYATGLLQSGLDNHMYEKHSGHVLDGKVVRVSDNPTDAAVCTVDTLRAEVTDLTERLTEALELLDTCEESR